MTVTEPMQYQFSGVEIEVDILDNSYTHNTRNVISILITILKIES